MALYLAACWDCLLQMELSTMIAFWREIKTTSVLWIDLVCHTESVVCCSLYFFISLRGPLLENFQTRAEQWLRFKSIAYLALRLHKISAQAEI